MTQRVTSINLRSRSYIYIITPGLAWLKDISAQSPPRTLVRFLSTLGTFLILLMHQPSRHSESAGLLTIRLTGSSLRPIHHSKPLPAPRAILPPSKHCTLSAITPLTYISCPHREQERPSSTLHPNSPGMGLSIRAYKNTRPGHYSPVVQFQPAPSHPPAPLHSFRHPTLSQIPLPRQLHLL